jgi:hypothetical protein
MDLFKFDSLRKLAVFLRQQPEVKKIKLEEGKRLHIQFAVGYAEHWSYNIEPKKHRHYTIPDDDLYAFDNRWPEFRCQFSRKIGDNDYQQKGKYFLYTHKYLSEYMFSNVRIFIHRLAESLSDEGYLKLWLSNEHINNEISKINKLNWKKLRIGQKEYKEQPYFVDKAKSLLLMRDLDISESWTFQNLFAAIDRIHKRKQKISRDNIVWHLRRKNRAKFSLGYPLALSALLRNNFPNVPIINHTNYDWVRISAMINQVEYNNSEGIHITEKEINKKPQIIIGDGDYTLINSRPDNSDYIKLCIL